MRILSLTYEYPPIGGGGGAVAAALNESLAATGDSIEVVTSRMAGLARNEIIGGVTVHRTSCWRRYRHFTTAAELATALTPAYIEAARILRERRTDLIHTHFVLPSGVIAYYLSRRFGVPYVLTAHGSDIPGYNPDRFNGLHRVLKPMWRRIVKNAAAVISPSQYLAGLVCQSIAVPVRVVPNGYTPGNAVGHPKRNLVLVVARLFPRKGVQHFLQSIDGLQTDWEFVIAGDGPYLDTLKEQAQGIRAAVRFTGFIDRRELRELYEQARILIFPSIRENFPMVLLEAMDAGCAIITTDAKGCAEVVGDAGVVIGKGNALQIREALVDLMTDATRCTALSLRAQARVRQFRWTRIGSLYRETFETVLRQAPVPGTAAERAASL